MTEMNSARNEKKNMGKGGGCFPSKNKITKTTNKYANSATKSTAADTTVPPKDDTILELPSPLELVDADGFLFGFPTRYGCMAAQMKAFFDSTGLLWKEQKLAGKPAGFFVSTGSQGGGQETTAWTAITQLAHHGMLFVPIGYTFGADMFDMDSIRGGSPYGAGVFAGDGSRKATETELAVAEYQGKYMAAVVKKLVHG
ncbi:putative NAD(P)H dehydrogenase (quinone) FQR1-like 2 isoform X3 [Nicotiana tabacum]|uniref:NAD(P)H dehydrogenase (Quinone) FQR1-like 2 isoform X3 n=1 Tax=Nicotiana tabacum TaxID=4097 RepID=A0AC58SLN8_TOBAC